MKRKEKVGERHADDEEGGAGVGYEVSADGLPVLACPSPSAPSPAFRPSPPAPSNWRLESAEARHRLANPPPIRRSFRVSSADKLP